MNRDGYCSSIHLQTDLFLACALSPDDVMMAQGVLYSHRANYLHGTAPLAARLRHRGASAERTASGALRLARAQRRNHMHRPCNKPERCGCADALACMAGARDAGADGAVALYTFYSCADARAHMTSA